MTRSTGVVSTRPRREEDINDYVKEFSKQTSRLHDNFDHHKSTAPDVETVLDRAARIDVFMSRHPSRRGHNVTGQP